MLRHRVQKLSASTGIPFIRLKSVRQFCKAIDIPLCCEDCRTKRQIKVWPGRTAYHVGDDVALKDDPNRPVLLCRDCAFRFNEHWDDMWSEYYNSRL